MCNNSQTMFRAVQNLSDFFLSARGLAPKLQIFSKFKLKFTALNLAYISHSFIWDTM